MTDVDDEPEATEDERREAEALARALEGLPGDAPEDAAATAAFLRAIAQERSIDARVAKVEGVVFGEPRTPSNVRSLPARGFAYAALLLASAAALFVVVRSGTMGTESAPAPVATAPSVQSAPVVAPEVAEAPSSSSSLVEAARALSEAAPGDRDAALDHLRDELAHDRDETLAALVAKHGGAP